MKLLIRITAAAAMALGLGLIVSAQQPAPAKVLAEVASGAAAVKGQPFSADTVNESVQTLADGNRIVQTMNGKIYRNSEGRVRREMTGGNGGNAGFGNNTFFFDYGPRVSIAEPAGGHRVLLNEKEKTAFTVSVVPEGEVKVLTQAGKGEGFGTGTGVGRGTGVTTVRTVTDGAPTTEEQRKAVETLRGYKEGDPLTPEQQKAKELLKAHSIELARTGAMLATTVAPVARGFATAAPGAEPWLVGGFGDSKWETKTDDLGTQNIEGVTCEGTRRTTTIPAGAIGNERPIEITYERWYSKDLGMVVMSKHSDPRFGDQTYTLKNIVRVEPDPSLFTVPREFRILSDQPGAATYKIRTPEAERELVRAKAATAPATPAAVKQP